MIGFKITKVSIDEQNHKYSVQVESGQVFTGYKALNMIRVRKMKNIQGEEYLESFIQPREVKTELKTN
jgi:hypothetical protein